MDRRQALRILGLDEDALPEDIKSAYKESAQILHPDRFPSNKKLQARATEQFKNLQQAYDYLNSGKGARGGAASKKKPSGKEGFSPRASQAQARLAGIAAARTQMVKQRDVLLDERRRGLVLALVAGVAALFAGRRPYGLFGVVAAIASAAAAWGVVQFVSCQRSISTLNEHIAKLNKEERQIKAVLSED